VACGNPMASGWNHGRNLGIISANSRHARRKWKKWKKEIEKKQKRELAVFDIDGTIFRKNFHFELLDEL
jgi:hypothetical protein